MKSFCVVALCATALTQNVFAQGSEPFTVADSIGMTRLSILSHEIGSDPFPMLNVSPNKENLITVIYSGDLASGENKYRLIAFKLREVSTYAASDIPVSRPSYATLAMFSISAAHDDSRKDAIDQVRWLPDSKYAAFVGRGSDGIGQIYTAFVENGKNEQLTKHPNDIAAFDISSDRSILVYGAWTPPDWSERNVHGYSVTAEYPSSLAKLDPNSEANRHIKYFIADLAKRSVKEVSMETAYLLSPPDIALSPSKKWAVVTTTIRNVPRHWDEYDLIKNDPVRMRVGTERIGSNEPTLGRPNPSIIQYLLVDIENGNVKPLLDAPARLTVATRGRVPPKWSPSGDMVLLPSTYLPLVADMGSAERRRRGAMESAVVVHVNTGECTEVFLVKGRSSQNGRPQFLADASWSSDDRVVARFATQRSNDVVSETYEEYRENDRRWVMVGHHSSDSVGGSTFAKSLRLRISQNLNTPPDIEVRAGALGARKLLTDLNPQFARKKLGSARLFSWTDLVGRRSTGGLVLPPDYVEGNRYPVVIQVADFDPTTFLLDSSGEGRSPMAARALANRGMVVLTMDGPGEQAIECSDDRASTGDDSPEARKWFDRCGETSRFVKLLESAIDALNAAGLIDPKRVGIIGFSRTGMYVHYALTATHYPIVAATVADSICLSPYCYALQFGSAGMDSFIRGNGKYVTIGAPLWGAGVARWIERSDLFHLDRIRSAIRYEAYGTIAVPGHWENFAVLKTHDRPVEYFHIPLAYHNLKAPYAAFASKQGNVEWYDFWLNGYEDPDPAKAEQYRRWRLLRRQREAAMKDPVSP